jgi:aminoglycoside phosphotransferase (APT) family kinase protein
VPDDLEPRVAAVLRRRLPAFEALRSLERLSGGASQETYRLLVATATGEHRLALRRTPGGERRQREPGHPGPEAEARLMQAAAAAGVPEPRVEYVLAPDDGLGAGFLMQWVDGEALGSRIVRAPELADVRRSLAYECGRILARIHGIDLVATELDGLLDTLPPERLVRQTWHRYQAMRIAQPMIDYAARWLLEHLPPQPRMALVHADFRNGNLMVAPGHGIVAVLDWEMAHIGDPMRDLGWLCCGSWRFGRADLPVGGFGEYAALFDGYASQSGQPVDPAHVRFWEVFGSFWWAVGCLTMADHFRRGPDRSVERAAIGRRSSECQVDCANRLIPGRVRLVSPLAPDELDMPRLDELVASVRDHLRADVVPGTSGRLSYLARVGANSLEIALRELELGPAARAAELAGLHGLFGAGDLPTLRWRLTQGLRDGSIDLDHPGVAAHLRETVVNRLAIDQPKYAGLQIALQHAGPA